MVWRFTIVTALLSLGMTGTARAADPHWEAAVDLGGAHTLGSAPLFDWVVCGGGSLLLRLPARFAVGAFVEYRDIVDSAPASLFWYADLGVRGRFAFTQRLWFRLDVGWGFRHIGLSDGYSNTAGGLMAGSGLGVILLARKDWNISLAAVYHFTWRTQSELFATQDVGLAAAWARTW